MTTTGHVNWRRWADEARQRGSSNQVNGRVAEPWETELMERARAAATKRDGDRLFSGVNRPKSNQ